jgi:hypothetical protein
MVFGKVAGDPIVCHQREIAPGEAVVICDGDNNVLEKKQNLKFTE